jgi:hypothetical protein
MATLFYIHCAEAENYVFFIPRTLPNSELEFMNITGSDRFVYLPHEKVSNATIWPS